MLYKKNSCKTLTDELFNNPTSEYRAAPFWSWNTKLDKDTITEQINHMKDMGFGGYHMHPRTGLDTEYLSDEFMEMVSHAHTAGIENDMLSWLYDEDRWSSGAAGGKVTATKEFRRKRLNMYTEKKWDIVEKHQALKLGVPYLLGCYDVIIDKDGFLESYKKIDETESAIGTKWYAYIENEKESTWFNGGTYPDAGNPEAIKAFIDCTYERYKEVLGDNFGKTIPSIFTDEPNLDHEKSNDIPNPEYKGRILKGWSLYFDDEYKKEYGQDIVEVLPEVIWNKKDRSDSIVKYRYFDIIAKLFSENFSKQIGDWCEQNGIALTGHLLREPKLFEQAITCGETMRSYEYMQLPGIDMLCDFTEFTTAKQAQSDVHQCGKEGMMTELYGVTGWDFDFRGHKFQGDWQAALGATVRVPHLYWMSMEGEAKRDYPAAIGHQSPWYKEYSYIEDHFARVNTAMTRGSAIVKIGVIHPIESYWINAGPSSQSAVIVNSLEENFANVTKWLLEEHLDFDYICESRIPKMKDGLKIGQMEYDAVVIPACLTLRKTTIDFLSEFIKNNKKIIFMGACPEYIDGIKSNGCQELYNSCEAVNFDKASISEALEDVREISISGNDGAQADSLLYNYRKDNDCNWLFIAHSKRASQLPAKYGQSQNDVMLPINSVIKIKGEFISIEYNTLTGEINAIECEYKHGFTIIKKDIHSYDSLLLKLIPGKVVANNNSVAELSVIDEFEIEGLCEYELSEPNVLLLDRAEFAIDNDEFSKEEEILRLDNIARNVLGFAKRRGSLAQPYTMKKVKPEHTLKLRFKIYSDIDFEGALLAMEDVEKNTLTFNGEQISNTPIGHFTDKSIKTVKLPIIKKGENVLEAVLPYGQRTNVEWCYILGDFGVKVQGKYAAITDKYDKIGFSDISKQALPFYAANVTYKFDVELKEDGFAKIRTSYYKGSLIAVEVDGKRMGRIAFPPYDLITEKLSAGKHEVKLTLFGNRYNSFGPLHAVNITQRYMNPDSWRSTGDDWCYEYNTKPFGILKSPVITILK